MFCQMSLGLWDRDCCRLLSGPLVLRAGAEEAPAAGVKVEGCCMPIEFACWHLNYIELGVFECSAPTN